MFIQKLKKIKRNCTDTNDPYSVYQSGTQPKHYEPQPFPKVTVMKGQKVVVCLHVRFQLPLSDVFNFQAT